MKTIWKFPVPPTDEFVISMPRGAWLLSFAVQATLRGPLAPMPLEQMCLWALVDPRAPVEDRRFALRGTGHALEGLEGTTFVGTVLLAGGALVFHLFDCGAARP